MDTRTSSQPVGKANEYGHDLYRWVQNGVEWACCAYDHGPMCRRCQPVGQYSAILDEVEAGESQMFDTDRGGWEFHQTDAPAR